MTIKNLSNPGKAPAAGDEIEITHSSGAIERKYFFPLPAPTRAETIRSELARLDALSDSPRARREAMLGNTAWLATLDTQAAQLRAELATL